MKKIFSILFIVVFAFVLVGCGDKVAKEVQEINDFVATLPEEITIELEGEVNRVIGLYDKLSKEDKEEVTNYRKLVEAKGTITDLKNQAAAQIIIDFINSLNETVTMDDESKYLDIKAQLDSASSEVIVKVTNKSNFDSKYDEYLQLKEGPSEEDKNKAAAVDILIDALPAEVTLDDKDQIKDARSAYVLLTKDQKGLVLKLNVLVEKEEQLSVLETFAIDKAKAEMVDTLITNLPVEVAISDKDQIEAARSSYSSLTVEQKAYVLKLSILEEKELELNSLINEANLNANEVISLINSIPTPVKSTDKKAIDNARNAYEDLSEYEKTLVSNYEILTEKESEYNELPVTDLTYEQRVQMAVEKITNEFATNLYVNNDLDFYLRDAEFGPAISWSTNNLEVINTSGEYTAPLFDTDLVITYTATLRSATESASIAVRAAAVSLDEKWGMIETFLDYINKDRIENTKYTMFGYEKGYERNPGEDLGFLMFYNGVNPEIIEDIVVGNKWVRTNVVKTSTEWIVIHDTGSGSPSADAYMHNNYIKSISGSSKSWHYTVGDDMIYHHLPNNETSWNAGDGSAIYELLPTGVKAITPVTPEVTINAVDGYYYLDNRKTDIIAPTGNIGQILSSADFNATGIYTEIGEDGYYYMAKTHSGSMGSICHTGGNKNSVSMETCVNAGSDYMMTMRKASALTAMLLLEFDLMPDRVRQHNTFSGKNCPQTIRTAGKWDEFMYMVNVEYYGRKYLNDVNFEYLPKGNYFDSMGMIVNHPGSQTNITYDVKVTYGGETRLFPYTSVIAGRMA